jgi:hypothetical protein
MIDSRNEWDPLESIIVGDISNANWPMTDAVFAKEAANSLWTKTPAPSGPVSPFIIEQTKRELDILADTLHRYGAEVFRPKVMNFVEERGMYNYCPRDRLLVAGDTIVDGNMMYPCRNQEIKNYYKLLANAKNILTMPRDQGMVLDAANICRLGDTWLFLESASGNIKAYEWLQRKFRKIKIELCNFYSGVHIDSTITPLAPVRASSSRKRWRSCGKFPQRSKPCPSANSCIEDTTSRISAGCRNCSASHCHCASPRTVLPLSVVGT